MASISRAEALAMSTPLTRTSPEDGFSRPTKVRSSVLLPEPEPPITTTVSPWTISNARPCRTSRSPYCTRRSRTEITEEGAAGAAILCGPPRQIEQRSEDQIDHDDQKDGDDHRRGGGAPHLFGARAGGEALLTADGGNDQPEDQRLDDAGGNVVGDQGVAGGNHVAAECKVGTGHTEHAPAQHAHEIGPDGEARHHHGHSQELRHHEERRGIE